MSHPALSLILEGDYAGAIAHCEAAIAQGKADPQPYSLLGLALLLQGNEAEAQTAWMMPLSDLEPDALEAYLSGLANLLEQALEHCLAHRQYLAAERLSRQLLELDEQAKSYYRLGLAQAQLGDLDAALASWQQAIALQPDFVEAWTQQAQTHQKLEQFAEAGKCYAAWTTLQPENADAWAGLGLCQGKLGDWAAAVQAWGQSHTLAPGFAPVLADLSYGLLQLGQVGEALSRLRQALWQRSDFAETYCAWATTPPQNPAVCANAAFLEALAAAADNSGAALHQAGTLLAQSGQLERAIALYQQSLQENPANFAAVIDLGDALVQTGQFSEAIARYQAALNQAAQRETRDAANLWLGLARAQRKQGNWKGAIASARQALSLDADSVEAHRVLGLAYLEQGEAAIAVDYWRSLLAQQPEAVDGWCNLAAALMQTGQLAEALRCLKTALRLNGNLAPQVADLMAELLPSLSADHAAEFQKTLPVDAPTREVRDLRTLAAAQPKRDTWIPVHPPQQIALSPPRSLDPLPHFSFRFGTAMPLPETFVATLPAGRFWIDPDQSSLAVFNAAGDVMRELSIEFPSLAPGHPDLQTRQHWVFSAQKLPPAEQISGTVAVLAGLSNNIYFHWMLDVLPRVKILQESGLDLSQIDYWLVGDRHSWQRDCLHHLCIPPEKILSVQEHLHIQADQLIVPSFPGAAAWPQSWVCDWLKASFLSSQALDQTLPRRLYVSRQKTRDRRVVNEASIVQLLESKGFTIVYLEDCTIVEQAQLFHNAELIISPHGSGLTNLVFCRPTTQVIELFSPNYVYPCYWYLSNLIGLDYAYHIGAVPAGNFWQTLLYPLVRIEDIWVDLDALSQLVSEMI
jgi:tetratricopeptide (TPR) repeat protein/capsular polysaccharide biosynthesis protein